MKKGKMMMRMNWKLALYMIVAPVLAAVIVRIIEDQFGIKDTTYGRLLSAFVVTCAIGVACIHGSVLFNKENTEGQ